MEQPSISERLAPIEVQLTHIPTRIEIYEKLVAVRSELRTEFRDELAIEIDKGNRRTEIFRDDTSQRFELLTTELQRQGAEHRKAINRLYVLIVGTAIALLTLGLSGITLILTQLPLLR